ncbi:MAG: ABC transporter ATP-binding protein [Pseudomonadota bacterium]
MDDTSNSPLELKHVSHAFAGRQVVDDLSFALQPGEVMCLLGPSGCGKSTTLRIAAGIEHQMKGEVWSNGQCMSNSREHHIPPEARGIGLVFQDFALFPHFNVRRNIGFGLKGNGAENQKRIDDLLERVNLVGFGGAYPHELSGGEQQRVALARAIAPSPKVLLMDEPFSGLDNRLRDSVRDNTLDLLAEQGSAVLLVTHDPQEAMRMANRIALMRAGKIIQIGAPYNIYNAPIDLHGAEFFSDLNIINGRVDGALTDTPFGQFLTPGIDTGQEVDIVIRPQHLKIDFDRGGRGPNPTPEEGTPARGVVKRARFMGENSLVEFQMDYQDITLKAVVPGVFMPTHGTVLWLSVRRDRCLIFAK